MHQRVRRFGLAACVSVALGFAALTVLVAIENYPAEDGLIVANGDLVGGDFLAFWIGGHIYENDRARLYDLPYQFQVRARLLGPASDAMEGELPFVYPPLVAAAVAPLSRLPLQTAFWIFAGFGLVSALGALLTLAWSVGQRSPARLAIIAVLALGYIPFGMNTVLGGQFPWLGIVILSLVAACLLERRDFMAGLILSLSYYKPPLFFLLLLTLLLTRGRRFAAGFAVGAGVLISLTVLLVGMDGLSAYLSVVSRYTYGQELTELIALPVSRGMGLVALGVTTLGSMKLTLLILSGPFVLAGVVAARRMRAGLELSGVTLLVVATLAFSLQFNKYDLALLLVPMVLLMAWQREESPPPGPLVWIALGAFYFESPFREVAIGGRLFNASWLFLTVLLGGLLYAASRPVEAIRPRES